MHKTGEQVKEREEVWGGGAGWACCPPLTVSQLGSFKGRAQTAATLPKPAPGRGDNGHPDPFCHPQVALPLAAPGEEAKPTLPAPSGSLGLFLILGTESCTQEAPVYDPRIPGPQACLKGQRTD